MRCKATAVILTALIFASVTLTASAQIPLNMSYQARLADSTGNPVPDGPYDLEFNFYSDSTGGVPIWTEQFFGVNTNNGFFDVFLEMELDNLNAPLFMEVMVGGDILSPRSRMASVPYSAISHRVQGDIITSEGYMVLTNADGDSCVEMLADGLQSSIKTMDPVDKREGFVAQTNTSGSSIRLIIPDEDTASAIAMSAGPLQSSIRVIDPVDKREGFVALTETSGNLIKLLNPGDVTASAIELAAGPLQSSIKVIDPVDKREGFVALTEISGNSIKLLNPDDDTASAILLSAGPLQSSIRMIDPVDKREGFVLSTETSGNSMKLIDPGDDEITLIEMNGSIDGNGTIKMFNPQPEPPAVVLEMNANQFGSSFAMAGPQAAGPGDQITDPMIEVIADSSGGAINIYDEIGKYLGFDPSPFTPGGLLRMYDPVAEDIKFEVSTTEDGAGIDIYDEIGKYMGFDPTPFTPGGYFYMIESTGFSVDTNLALGSDGYIRAENGVTIGPNTNTGIHTLVMGANTSASGDNSFAGGRHAQADHDNCFAWSDFPLGPSIVPLQTSADNQFLVRSSGGIRFFTNANLTSGVELTPGATSWSAITTLDGVRNLRPVDGKSILNKIEQLPISRYSYRSENESAEHIGPLANDLHKQFGVGPDDKHISAQDQSGIALAGIKELISIINDLKTKNAELERRIVELEKTR